MTTRRAPSRPEEEGLSSSIPRSLHAGRVATASSDGELLRRLARGDGQAIGLLYDRYARVLLPLALRIVRDRAEAEDLVHDAFVMVSERAGQYSADRGSVAAWLVTLVRNLSIDRTRRRHRRATLVRTVLAREPVEPVGDPETLMSDALERDAVRRVLLSLPDVQRQTLEVAFFEGLNYPEIAERQGVPLGTIKSRAGRAMAALRRARIAVSASPGGSTSSSAPEQTD